MRICYYSCAVRSGSKYINVQPNMANIIRNKSIICDIMKLPKQVFLSP